MRSYLQVENFAWTSLEFRNPSWKGKRKEGNLNPLTTTITRALRSEQWAVSKPGTSKHHSRASRSGQWAAIGEGEGTETSLLTSKLFFISKTSISFNLKTAQEVIYCTKSSIFRSSEFNRFLVAQIGEVISIFALSLSFEFFPSKSRILLTHHVHVHP